MPQPSRINKQYNIGSFDTFAEIKEIDSYGTDIDDTPVLSAATSMWLMVDDGFRASDADDREGSQADMVAVTRLYYNATPHKTLVFIGGVQYEVKKVQQIGRRLHTRLFLFKA